MNTDLTSHPTHTASDTPDQATTATATPASTHHGDHHDFISSLQHQHENLDASTDDDLRDVILPPSIVTYQRHPRSRNNHTHDQRDPQPATRFDRRVRAKADDDSDAESAQHDSTTSIDILPTELITRVFTHLDPASLARCARVRKQWALVVKDDATWRRAFASTFGAGDRAICLRRTSQLSWKSEFIRRTDLIRRWKKSRSPAISTDMRVNNISEIAYSSSHNFMLSASLAFGIASRSDPFKGKVARGFLDAAGLVTNNNGAEAQTDVTALDVAHDASRITWAFRDGSIAATLLTRQGSNPRGMIRSIRFSPRGAHVGPVNDVAFDLNKPGQERRQQRRAALGEAAEVFVTGGRDGRVKLWSPARAVPLWEGVAFAQDDQVASTSESSQEDPNSRRQPLQQALSKVDLDADRGIVVAGSTRGSIYAWSGLDIPALLAIPSTAWEDAVDGLTLATEKRIEARRALSRLHSQVLMTRLLRSPPGEEAPIATLFLDASDGADDAVVLAHRAGETSLCHIRFAHDKDKSPLLTTLVPPKNVVSGKITCLRADVAKHSGSDSLTPSPQIHPVSSSPGLVLGPAPGSLRNLKAGTFAERRFVCAGTDDGKLIGWRLPDATVTNALHFPAFALDCHHTGLTSVDFTPHLLAVGCTDGTVKAFDALTGELVRTWSDRTATRHPARMLAAGELTPDEAARFTVKRVIVSDESILAAIGPHLLAWRAEAAITGRRKLKTTLSTTSAGHASSTTSSRGGGSSAAIGTPLSKYAQMREIKHELAESSTLLQAEKEQRQAAYDRLRYARGDAEMGGMSEQEALEYALMLSRDDEEARQTAMATEQSQQQVQLSELARIRREEAELQDALERIALAQGNEDESSFASSSRASSNGRHDEDEDNGSDEYDYEEHLSCPRQSPSPLSSPPLAASTSPRAWNIISNAGAASRWGDTNTRWGDAAKVRTVAVPRAARQASFAGGNGGSSALLSPSSLTAMAASGSHSSGTPYELDSQEHWPSIASTSLPRSYDQQQPSVSPVSLGGAKSPVCLTADKGKAAVKGVGSDTQAPLARNASSFGGSNASPIPSPLPPSKASAAVGAWAKGKPAIKSQAAAAAVSSPPNRAEVSAATSSVPSRASPGDEMGNDFDADLRFAIELSLAEEKSRQQAS